MSDNTSETPAPEYQWAPVESGDPVGDIRARIKDAETPPSRLYRIEELTEFERSAIKQVNGDMSNNEGLVSIDFAVLIANIRKMLG
jgi:hypothetical protein